MKPAARKPSILGPGQSRQLALPLASHRSYFSLHKLHNLLLTFPFCPPTVISIPNSIHQIREKVPLLSPEGVASLGEIGGSDKLSCWLTSCLRPTLAALGSQRAWG